MNAREQDHWELVSEFGLEYAERAAQQSPVDLVWPVVAEHLPGAGYLIVDEHPIFSNPRRTDCRTLLFSDSREPVFNSKDHGIEGGYGCVMHDGNFAVLDRRQQEIRIYSRIGALIYTVGVPRLSPHAARIISWTSRNSFLVGFLDMGRTCDLAELDAAGRVLWSLVSSDNNLSLPSSLQLLPSDAILFANDNRHAVQEVKRDGSIRHRFGRPDYPSADPDCLFNPKWARQLDDGTLLIADGNNHRCLSVDSSGWSESILPKDRALFVPSCITRTEQGNLLICDVGLKCVMELDPGGHVMWQLGGTKVRKRHLSFPRSVERIAEGRLLVADTAQNRIVEIDGTNAQAIPVLGTPGLFWPRSAQRTASGTTVVADGRNSRVVEIAPDGRVLRELREVRTAGRTIPLQDPHDARPLPNGRLLVTDSSCDIVCEADWDGCADWIVGIGNLVLNDPHSAQFLRDGRIAIADSGNHRLLFVDVGSGMHQTLTGVSSRFDSLPLHYPRYAQGYPDGSVLIVDSHNHRVIAVDADGSLLWELKHVRDSPIPHLIAPRWATLGHSGNLFVCDHFNHRILHLRRLAAAKKNRGLMSRSAQHE